VDYFKANKQEREMKKYSIPQTPDGLRHFTSVSPFDYSAVLTVVCHSLQSDTPFKDAPKPYVVGSIPRIALDDIRPGDLYHSAGFDYRIESIEDNLFINVVCIN
jgi:hypothetical protein